MLEERDTYLQNRFVEGLRLPELQEYLRLQYADLSFDEIVKKARYYVEIKDIPKPKKASVRFATTERELNVNVITPSTVDVEPIINYVQNIKHRMDKMERRGESARSSTSPGRSTLPASPPSQNSQRSRSLPRPQKDNTSYRRVQFEDQQPERFNNVPPPNYFVSLKPRRF